MALVDDLTRGRYLGGDSPLHRLDPRLKLGLLLALVVSLFAGADPLRLLLLAGLGLAGLLVGRVPLVDCWRGLLLLRWLLLFTLLLHLFFTPGRTLFGTSWLSYDGLLRGLTVDLQLLLALLFSMLLALTTPPAQLAWGLARLLAPLKRLGLPVQEAGGLLLLVLHFVPLIRQELSALRLEQAEGAKGLLGRARQVRDLLGPLLLRLVDRADCLAKQIVAGADPLGEDGAEISGRFGSADRLVLLLTAPLLVLIWLL